MKNRIKIFTTTFLIVAALVFCFYYTDTKILLDAIALGIIGGFVVGSIAALLIPFVLKRNM